MRRPTTPPGPVADPTVPLRIREEPPDALPVTHLQPVDTTPLPAILAGNFPRVRGYEILALVGTGGMGVVYEARHRELNRRVAIKTLRGEALADPEFHARFRAEAEAIAKLQHPNVIQVFEVGTVEPAPGELRPGPFLALEFVDGGSLAARARGPQLPRFAAGTVAALARAAHAAHLLGIIHRDLKPANVLIGRDGEPKIADFGIAKQLDTATAVALPVTRAGTVMGTPEYMPPEQLEGETATAAIDVYALGVILYELLTGRVPFQGATFAETMRLTLHQEPVPPHRLQPGVPRDLETICLKCLEKAPGKRYASAEALADDLGLWLAGRAIRARTVGPLGRGARWARRNPAIAGLSVAVLLIACAGFAGIVWNWDQAVANKRTAEGAAELATEETRKATAAADKERWERYRVSLMAASSALRLHDGSAAARALDSAPGIHRDWVWNLLSAQLDRAQHVLGGEPRIEGAEFTPNGRWALTWRPDHSFRVWDLVARREYGPFPGVKSPTSFALSGDGTTLALGTAEHTVALVDVPTGRVRATLRGHTGELWHLAFTPDGTQVVSTSADRTARLWDAATGRELNVCRAPRGAPTLIASPDGRFVACKSERGHSAHCWELRTGRELGPQEPCAEVLLGVLFSPTGDRLVTTGAYPHNTLRLWDTVSGKLLATLDGHENQVNHATFSPDGTRLASASLDRTVRVWDVGAHAVEPKTRLLHTLYGHNGSVNAVAFGANGTRLLSAGHDRTLRYWNTVTGRPVAVLCGHEDAVFRTVLRDDGAVAASFSADGTIRLWDARAAENDYAIRGHEKYVYGAAFFPDGVKVASCGWDGTARVWDATTGTELLKLDHGKLDVVSSVAIDRSGKLLATLARKSDDPVPGAVGGVRLWEADTGKLLHLWPLQNHDYRDGRVTFDPAGARLAVGCPDHRVRVWDVATRREVAVLEGHTSAIEDVAFSPDGRLLASASTYGDGTVRIWDLATNRTIATLKGSSECVSALAWNPKRAVLAAGSPGGEVVLWDTTTWAQVKVLKHGSDVLGLTFSRDGKMLTTAARDTLIRFWSLDTYQELAALSGHMEYVRSVAFSRDGTRLVSASGDKTVRVWDTLPRGAR